MFRTLIVSLVCIGSIALPTGVLAQSAAEAQDAAVVEAAPTLTAVIRSVNRIKTDRAIIFDGSESINPDEARRISYKWEFGDETAPEFGNEVVHTYGKPGTYTVTLTISNGLGEHTVTKDIIVYDRLFVAFVDKAAEQSLLDSAAEYAQSQGHLLQIFQIPDTQSDYLGAEALVAALSEHMDAIKDTDILVLWTSGNASLGALSDFVKGFTATTSVDLSQKTIVYITDDILNIVRRIAQSTFRSVQPERIVLTRAGALHTIIDVDDPDEIAPRLAATDVSYKIVDTVSGRLGPLNFMSYLVDFMRNHGVPDRTIFLILIIPVIATIIAFIRQIIGISTAGIYAPAIITISLIALGLLNGIAIFLVIMLASLLSRQLVKQYNIMYIPRMAIVLTLTTLAIFLVLLIGSYLEIPSIINIQIFPLLILIAMAEKFLSVEAERGTRSSVILMGETLLVAIICYLIVNQWSAFYTFMLAYPEMIFVLLIINFLIGRWTGLRLTEYFRFRQVLTSVEHAEEE